MVDKWFEEKFIEIASRLSVIETQVKETNGTCKEHEIKIRDLEDDALVKKTEEKFHRKHPIATGGIVTAGGLSGLTLAGLVIKFVIENWPF